MKKTILLSFCVFVSVILNSQENIDDIKNSGSYYYGQSSTFDIYEKAEKKAFDLLTKNMLENIETNLIDFGLDDPSEHLSKILLTFENKLKSKRKIIDVVKNVKNDEYACLAFISKDDFNQICDERISEIQRYADIALNKESDGNMVDALRSYYWSMMLCVAHPQGLSVKIKVDDETVDAYYYLYERVTEALDSFDFSLSKDNPGEFNDEGVAVNLNVRSFGNDVSNLQIKYYNGLDNYHTTTINNGKAQLQLAAKDIKEVEIRIEYEFLHETIAHPEVKKVVDNLDKIILKKNVRKTIDLTPYLKYFSGDAEHSNVEVGVVADLTKLNDSEKYYLDVMHKLENALRVKHHESVREYFTPEAFAMLDTLVRNGNISVLNNQEYEFITCGNTTICRDIELKFEFRNHASFLRDVVLRFDNTSKLVTSLAFRLSSVAEHDITSKKKWLPECKQTLINFLEDYQTAYALKRYDYLESIYSDDALIIVGHVVKKNEQPMKDRREFNLSDEEITLMKYNKDQYFGNLSRTFKAQEYINIRFTETDFIRQQFSDDENNVGGEDIFGVRLLQEYHSTTYGDVGYLFLMVDLRDNKRPIIHVRAWQPDKVDLDKLVGLGDLQ